MLLRAALRHWQVAGDVRLPTGLVRPGGSLASHRRGYGLLYCEFFRARCSLHWLFGKLVASHRFWRIPLPMRPVSRLGWCKLQSWRQGRAPVVGSAAGCWRRSCRTGLPVDVGYGCRPSPAMRRFGIVRWICRLPVRDWPLALLVAVVQAGAVRGPGRFVPLIAGQSGLATAHVVLIIGRC